jgi:hypothetical protein
VAHIYRGPEFRHVQDRICEQAHGGMRMKSKLRSCWPLHPNR